MNMVQLGLTLNNKLPKKCLKIYIFIFTNNDISIPA